MGSLTLLRAIETLTAAGVEEPRLEAQLLLMHLLQVSRASVIAETYLPLTHAQEIDYEQLVRKRAHRVPHAYLRGFQEFYGLTFEVGPGALIPRPETEMLVDFVLDACRQQEGASLRFADVGAGTGCIAIAALAHSPNARAVGFDLSGEALALARRNAVRNDVAERLGLVGGDLLLAAATGRYDLIVSNPPYIATAEIAFLQPEVRDFEPRLALDGGPDGLAAYRALCAQARRALKPGGSLAFEVGQGQAPHVAALLHQAGFDRVETRHDLAGIERVVVAHREL